MIKKTLQIKFLFKQPKKKETNLELDQTNQFSAHNKSTKGKGKSILSAIDAKTTNLP